ncbi:MAG: hypothetical protein V8R63_06510 [Thomasclavelia ramosa]
MDSFYAKNIVQDLSKPIIIVTSRNNEMDELMCINYGADDFVTKPYNPLILLARIEAVLKRTQPTSDVLISYEKDKIRCI